MPANPTTGTRENLDDGPQCPLRRGSAVMVGLVTGAVAIGFGLLARWGLSWTGLAPGLWSRTVLLVIGVAVLATGMGAGLAARRQTWRGVVVLVFAGLLAVVLVRNATVEPAALAVPVVAAVAAATTLLLAVRRDDGAAYDGADRLHQDVEPGTRVPRRGVLVFAGLLALAAAAGGLFAPRAVPGAPLRSRTTGPQADGEPLRRGTVLDARTFGAVGDGRTDDSAALVRGLDAASRSSATLFLPAGVYRCASPATLVLKSGITLSGEPDRSVIEFAAPGSGGFGLGCSVEGSDVTIDGVVLRRGEAFDSVLIGTGTFQRLTLSRVVLDGAIERFPDHYCHGIKLSDNARSAGLRLVDCTVTSVQYGLFQTNQSTAVTSDVVVQRCLFRRNHNTDLEFNSPTGATRHVEVRECRFEDNESSGFGVGLANVDGATVADNTFRNYAMEAVHVEDYSLNVVVESNDLTACGLAKNSYVQILSGARDVIVRSNTFDASTNTANVFAVTSQPGGTGLTGGGRQIVPPSGVEVRDNWFNCSPAVVPLYIEGSTGAAVVGNQFLGEGLGAQDSVVRLLGSQDTTISGNTVNGTPF